jgi:hypothetical protein
MLKVKNPKEFCAEIERYCKDSGLTYMESIIQYCDENALDIESVCGLMTPLMKEKLQYEAEGLNMLPKTCEKLPL